MEMTHMMKRNDYSSSHSGEKSSDSGKNVVQLNDKHDFPGPLLSKTMRKEALLRFIVQKSLDSLEVVERNKAEPYFFWQIMELFCRRNGKVMMCEVAVLLFRCHSLLRKKTSKCRDAQSYREWSLPLAQLLCSAAPDHDHRKAVIKMGDDLAYRGLIYAAHICYVVAKVELGSRAQFDLIGYASLPFGLDILNEAIVRTETYEYVLSLTSGLPQPSFQIFKLCYANRLAMIEIHDLAFAYCKTIGRAVITFPASFKRTFMKRVIQLSCKMHEEQHLEKESDWLLKLRQLYGVKVAETNVNADPEQRTPSSSSDVDSEIQDSGSGPTADRIRSPYLEQPTAPAYELDVRYTSGNLLGRGGFGVVYAGERVEDRRPVAIKYVPKRFSTVFMTIPGETSSLPIEVALMKIVSRPPHCSNIVELLEWFDLEDHIVMVLERPSPCMDLKEFIKIQNGHLSEARTRSIMQQVIQATRHCCDRRVLHRDIKTKNLLINTDTMQVKLIDFGCGDLLKDTTYDKYIGTPVFVPPEWVMFQEYNGIPATIWGLGVLLYDLIVGEYPFHSQDDIGDAHLKLPPTVSRDLLELLMWCLEVNPESRPSFDDLLNHEWFTEGAQDNVQTLPESTDIVTP